MLIQRNGGADTLILEIGTGGVAEIYDIVVFTERGKGVGTDMVNEAIEICKKLGIGRLFAITRDTNTQAQKFYKKLGFYGVPLVGFYPDGNALMFILKI